MTNTPEQLKISLYKAKVLGSDNYIIGFYAYDEVHNRHFILTNGMHGLCETKVDSTTLVTSFDNGTTWRSMHEIQSALHLQDSSGCYEKLL